MHQDFCARTVVICAISLLASGQPNDKAATRETSFNEVSSIPDLLSSSPSGYMAVLLTAGVLLAVAVGMRRRYKPRARMMGLLICVLLGSYCIVKTALQSSGAQMNTHVHVGSTFTQPSAPISQDNWCVLTDGARPISESECNGVLLAPEKGVFSTTVPCLNREFARQHGMGFLHAQSPGLDLVVSGSESWPIGQARQELVTSTGLCAPNTGLFVDKGGSDSIASNTTDSKRGLTWCKVLLLQKSISLLRGCPVIVWVDDDMLLQRHSRRTE